MKPSSAETKKIGLDSVTVPAMQSNIKGLQLYTVEDYIKHVRSIYISSVGLGLEEHMFLLYYQIDPAHGSVWVLKQKMPNSLLRHIRMNPKFTNIVENLQSLWRNKEEVGFEDIKSVEMDWCPPYELGRPTSGQFFDEPHFGEPVEMIVERSTKALLALSVQHLLHVDLFKFAADDKTDLVSLLKDPSKVKNSDLAKWIIWMVREELILEAFGSLESFFGTLFRLREEGRGYLCRLYQCDGFSFKLAECILRDDQDGLKMLSFLYRFASTLDERQSRELSFVELLAMIVTEFDWWEGWNPGTNEEFQEIYDFCRSKGFLADCN